MFIIYLDPNVGYHSWYVTRYDKVHIQEISEQIEAMVLKLV